MTKIKDPISPEKSILFAKSAVLEEVIGFFDDYQVFKNRIKEIISLHDVDEDYINNFVWENLNTEIVSDENE